jgi:hypothetical protein
MWEPRRLTTLWAFAACYRDSFISTFTSFIIDGCFKLNTNYMVTDRDITPLVCVRLMQFAHRIVKRSGYANIAADF